MTECSRTMPTSLSHVRWFDCQWGFRCRCLYAIAGTGLQPNLHIAETQLGVCSLQIMRIQNSKLLALATLIAVALPLSAQQSAAPRHQDTEVYEPVPPVITPGATDAQPPSDAIVLFDGKNLDQWVMNKDKSPAKWIVS